MQNWGDDLKKGFTTGQYIAAKSKDKEVKKAAKEESLATEKSPEERLKQLHKVANKYFNYDLSEYENNENVLGFIYYVYYNLDLLADNLNKLDEKKSAEKLKERMEKYKLFDKAQKIYKEQYLSKIEKAGVSDGPKTEENSVKNTKSEVSKEVTDETTDTIKENNNLLTPLAKKANIDGNVLRNFVSAKLRKTLDEKISKKGTREAVQKALGGDVILGTCIMVLGALITKDEAKIKAISEQIGSNTEELKNKLTKYEKQYK